jgi:arginine N-succinyltransferase
MIARTDDVTSVRNSVRAVVGDVDLAEGERAILATGRLDTFRACYGARTLSGDADSGYTIAIDSAAADALDVGQGDEVWSVAR